MQHETSFERKIRKADETKDRILAEIDAMPLPAHSKPVQRGPRDGDVEAATPIREGDGEEPPAPKLIPVDLSDLSIATPPRYVLEPVIPRGHVTLLGGHGGTGKSTAGLIAFAHVACGKPLWGLPAVQGKCLFVSLEDSGSLCRWRLRRIVDAYRLDMRTVMENLRIVDGSESDAALAFEHADHGVRRLMPTNSMQELRELSKGCSMVVIDNASDGYDANENDRRMVRSFFRLLAQIARDLDLAVVLLAHIDKSAARLGSGGNTYSGSTAWHNSARSRLALIETDRGIELRHEKNNLGKKIGPISLTRDPHGVLVLAHAAEEPSTEADTKEADAQAVLSAIRAAISAGADVPTARTGPANTAQVLRTFPELPKELRSNPGKDRFWDAIARLHREGLIKRETYTDRHRNQRERWVLPTGCVRSLIPPIPPLRTNARTGVRVSPQGMSELSGTNETNETDAEPEDGTL